MRPDDTRTFRATIEAWVGQLLLPLGFYCLLAVTAVRAAGMSRWIAGVGLAVVALVGVLDLLLPMLRNWLRVDARTIEGSLNGRYFHAYWTEILAAWTYQRRLRRFLCLGTRDGTLIIPLRFLDERGIWQHVSALVRPEALAEDAIQRLPDFQEWEAGRAQLLESASASVIIDHWLIQVAGWGGLTFFIFCVVKTAGAGRIAETLLYLALAMISGSVLLNWGITELDAQSVERNTVFGALRIAWEDVRSIEFDALDTAIVFVGENCRLAIPGPWLWAGANKKAALAMILAQADKYHIPLRRNPWAIFKASRNTRVRR